MPPTPIRWTRPCPGSGRLPPAWGSTWTACRSRSPYTTSPPAGSRFPSGLPTSRGCCRIRSPARGSITVLFHEYGHTLHGVLIRPDLPLSLLSFDPQPGTEGLGETLGHFAFDRRFLARVGGVNPEQAAALERLGKLEQLLWLRRTIGANAYAEIQGYLDLTANFDSVYAESYRRFVGVELPPGDYAWTRDFYGTAPLYFPAYLYANMFAAQVREAMRKEFGVEDLTREPRVAGWLTRNFYGPGQSIPWQDKVRRSTGRALDSRALVEFLAVDVGS